LKDLQVYVPPPHMLEYIANLRNVRFQNKARKQRRFAASGRPVRSSLSIVRSQTHALLDYLARRRIQLEIRSARKRAEEAAKVMSLDDIIASGRGRLKAEAQTLHNHLEQALACLLDKLIELPPSVRLLWQQFAEDDRLLVEQVERWPGLERAERDDFIATRTLAELVAWWFRQLDQDASAQARSAMRNMIRAAVIHSALGDPTEILQGQVHMPPRRLAVGEPLRIKLNRPAKPGTILQLMDQQQRLVAMLNVEDDDDKGTIANITRVTYSSASITTAYRVVASKATGKSL
jgi:hypothetical protein